MVEEALPIDTLEANIPKDGFGATVRVGAYVYYGRTLSRDPIDAVRIELRLDKHWRIESQAARDENAGADLIWSFGF